jgi:hypothetical protein
MDYLYIGSTGFAQVGQPGFHLKNKAEMAVLMDYLESEALTEQIESCYHQLIDDPVLITITHETEAM